MILPNVSIDVVEDLASNSEDESVRISRDQSLTVSNDVRLGIIQGLYGDVSLDLDENNHIHVLRLCHSNNLDELVCA